jgi:hypothetical protein
MRGDDGPPDAKRRVDGQLEVLDCPSQLLALQMEVAGDQSFAADVHFPKLCKHLRMRRTPASAFPGDADLNERRADRAANRPFDEGHALVLYEHCARDCCDGCPVVDAMFDGNCRLGLWKRQCVR